MAIALPTLIAFNVVPSAAAFVGWGVFLLVLGAMLSRHVDHAARRADHLHRAAEQRDRGDDEEADLGAARVARLLIDWVL